jgi:hypothetical protein
LLKSYSLITNEKQGKRLIQEVFLYFCQSIFLKEYLFKGEVNG